MITMKLTTKRYFVLSQQKQQHPPQKVLEFVQKNQQQVYSFDLVRLYSRQRDWGVLVHFKQQQQFDNGEYLSSSEPFFGTQCNEIIIIWKGATSSTVHELTAKVIFWKGCNFKVSFATEINECNAFFERVFAKTFIIIFSSFLQIKQ